MNDTHDVLSAVLDGEPFDPEALLAALTDPAGRELLIDLAVLRQIVQPSAIAAARFPSSVPRPAAGDAVWLRPAARWGAAVAAIVAALAGAYVAGTSREAVTTMQAPAPTRVVHATVVNRIETGGPQ